MAFIIALLDGEALDGAATGGDFADAILATFTLAALLTVLIDLSVFAISTSPAVLPQPKDTLLRRAAIRPHGQAFAFNLSILGGWGVWLCSLVAAA
jgi:hypothetical protein